MKLLFFIILLFTFVSVAGQQIITLNEGTKTNIRGLSVVDDNIAWASGSNGYIARTVNSGKNWQWQQVKGCEKADFRDIEAFSATEAVIMASGTPALILKTIDGGVNWQLTYQNTDTAYFLDAMDFASPKHGWVLGDPVNNKFLLLETKDGGKTWTNNLKIAPKALSGEAAFAASGTCLSASNNMLTIVTGGSVSRTLSHIKDDHWVNFELPIKHGQPSQGAFSIAAGTGIPQVIVGGDYANPKLSDSVATVSNYGASYATRLVVPDKMPTGYQSCVEYIEGKTFLSTGTSGTHISTDAGLTWHRIDTTSYNVCGRAKTGKWVLLAGSGGKISMLKF